MRALLVLASFLCVQLAFTTEAPVPLFLWSGESYLSGNTVGEFVTHSEIGTLLSHLGKSTNNQRGVLHQQVDTLSSSKPEIVFAFIYDKLSSSDVSRNTDKFSTLKSVLSSSKSKLTFPYVTPQSTCFVLSLNTRFDPETTTLIGDANGCQSFLSELDSDLSIFSNGRTDLVIIQGQDPTEGGRCLQTMTDYVNSKTNGHFVGVLSADVATAQVTMAFPESAPSSASFSTLSTSSSSSNPVGPQYITPDILLALGVSWGVLSILVFMVYCTMSIETPLRYSSTPLPLSKEY